MDVQQITSWWSIARDIGAGATFVLGIAVWMLWQRLSAEQDYSRTRDKETLQVLNAISGLVSQTEREADAHTEKVIAAITACQQTVIMHIERAGAKNASS